MRSSAPSPPGFSLVELMVSMAIGSIILLLAASMLGNSGDNYERVGGGVATEREARALITQLAADLETGFFNKDGLIEQSTVAWPVDRLGFLSLQPAQAQSNVGRIGDLCAVNYYVKDLTMGGKTVRCLMRGFRESKDTFKALADGTVTTLFLPQTIDEPVAFAVVSFEARPRSRNSTGQWIDWVKNNTTGPEAFDVKLVLARRNVSGNLKTPSDWNGTGNSSDPLGQASTAVNNKNLGVYRTSLRFGNDVNP